jgi:tellurite resistance protein TerB
MFKAFQKAFGAGAKQIKADYSQNKDYLEAVCAASALVAFADGELEDAERSKAIRTITQHPKLGEMYRPDAIESTVDAMFKRAKDASGRQLLARELDDIKGREGSMAEDVYLVALDVAMSDGTLEPEEEVVLKKLAARLGVDLSKFEF